MTEHKHTNALVRETSPYLLQHAHNPVNWYPWGPEALTRAREEDKPILLSVGYSACHWCHVMEHESFENEATAAIMNENFVNIKVDREERPDLDAIYMNAVQMMTGHGGWPMTVFLTPDQIPFYAGTYFPPEDGRGMPGFPRLLRSIAAAYREKRAEILNDSAAIVGELRKTGRWPPSESELTTGILGSAAVNLMANYDSQHGGFGLAPKFPPSMALSFLLRLQSWNRDSGQLQAVEHTLERMACGGIYDQLGGGFHRYSVDREWLVPHFEKMLYDNALLSRIYIDAFLVTRKELYGRVAKETLDYVVREMTSPEGGFYSAQDADSEGEEGRFFLWTAQEVEALLGTRDADPFCRYYDISPEGNFEGRNILHIPREAGVVARLARLDEGELRRVAERGRRILFEEREKRIRPERDEKILTAWNGLMLRSFAEAANALDREDYRAVAVRNAEFVLGRLRREGRLLRTYRDGEAKLNAYLEDYSFLLDGLLSLYEATFDPKWLSESEELAEITVRQFWDDQAGAFFFTSADHETLITRPKELYDNATPSGNSSACSALYRLSRITGNSRWESYSETVLGMLAEPMARYPSAFGNLLCALDLRLSRPTEIAVVGDPGSPATKLLLREVFSRYLPNKVLACGTDDDVFLLKDRPQIGGQPTAYVCENYACRSPVNDPDSLGSLLDSLSGARHD